MVTSKFELNLNFEIDIKSILLLKLILLIIKNTSSKGKNVFIKIIRTFLIKKIILT